MYIQDMKDFLNGKDLISISRDRNITTGTTCFQLRSSFNRLRNYFELEERGVKYPLPTRLIYLIPEKDFWLDLIDKYERGLTASDYSTKTIEEPVVKPIQKDVVYVSHRENGWNLNQLPVELRIQASKRNIQQIQA